MKNKGFTLVEILAVLIIMSLLMAVAIPSSIAIGNRIKEKLLKEKISLAEKSAILWAQNNKKCFTSSGCSDYPNTMDSQCTIDTNLKTCTITFDFLALEEYMKYDEVNIILNPLDNEKCLNLYQIQLSYNKKNKAFSASLKEGEQNSTCPAS